MAHEINNNQLTYLYRVTPGVCNSSFGMQIAEIAGLPVKVIERAREKSKWFKEHRQ